MVIAGRAHYINTLYTPHVYVLIILEQRHFVAIFQIAFSKSSVPDINNFETRKGFTN